MATQNEVNAYLRQQVDGFSRALAQVKADHTALLAAVQAAQSARSITEEIDAIPGRRIYYNLNGRVTFDATNAGQRGQPITFLVSQDGPFIQTHYPLAIWRPSAPATATQFGFWRPVETWPLPTQQVTGDFINISYEVADSGSQRNFQNEPTPPVLSRPDNMVPLSVPTLFTPNATITFTPTYESIFFDPAAVTPTTAGILVVSLVGYRVVNL
jgi:hypothetical protein